MKSVATAVHLRGDRTNMFIIDYFFTEKLKYIQIGVLIPSLKEQLLVIFVIFFARHKIFGFEKLGLTF